MIWPLFEEQLRTAELLERLRKMAHVHRMETFDAPCGCYLRYLGEAGTEQHWCAEHARITNDLALRAAMTEARVLRDMGLGENLLD